MNNKQITFIKTPSDVVEVKTVAVSTKRQFTIPKTMMDTMNNPEQFRITQTEEGLFLEPLYEEDEEE